MSPAGLRIGSLFSGIGGLELGLEWAGVGRTVWQCELDPFCRKVLRKNWPGVEVYEDVRKLKEPPPVEVLCGGFPCPDVAAHGGKRSSGGGRGLDGDRSGPCWSGRKRCFPADGLCGGAQAPRSPPGRRVKRCQGPCRGDRRPMPHSDLCWWCDQAMRALKKKSGEAPPRE